MWLLLALAGCPQSPPEDSGREDTAVQDLVDVDEDGVPAGEDCNDYNPENFPGNSEVWDGRDNDCDDRVDGEGHYVGTHHVEATAIYEGQPVLMELTCTAVLDRTPGVLDFEVVCEPDEGDSDAALLLGTVTVVPRDNGVTGAAWNGAIDLSSSNGWSARGTGQGTWQTMDRLGLWTRLESASLEWQGAGELEREAE